MSGVSLQGRNAVVAHGGGALGRAIALRLAEAGANVALTHDGDDGDAHEVAREIEAKGRLAIVLRMGRDRAAIDAAAQEARSALGLISVLVTITGAANDSDFQSALMCAQAFLPLLAEPGNGAIVHVGPVCESGAAPDPISNAALISLSQGIARAGAPQHVRANAVAPGAIQTDMGDFALSAAMGDTGGNILLKRLGTPDEVADAVLFLSSDASSYVTGETLNVNGGLDL